MPVLVSLYKLACKGGPALSVVEHDVMEIARNVTIELAKSGFHRDGFLPLADILAGETLEEHELASACKWLLNRPNIEISCVKQERKAWHAIDFKSLRDLPRVVLEHYNSDHSCDHLLAFLAKIHIAISAARRDLE